MIISQTPAMLSSKEKELLRAKSIDNLKPVNPIFKQIVVKIINLTGKLLFILKRNKLPGSVKKILFVSLYFNGDVLFQSPLFDSVKKMFPDAEIHFWIKNRAKGIMKGYPYAEKLYIYGNIRTRRFDEDVELELKAKFAFFKKLKAEKYDIVFDLTGLFWTAFAVLYMRPKYSAGFNYQGFDFVYNFSSTAVTEGHLIDRHLNLITENNAFSNVRQKLNISKTPVFYIAGDAASKIDELENIYGLANTKKRIVLHTSAGWESKKWDLENFVELTKLFPPDICIMLIGGPEDVKNNDYIVKNSNRVVHNFAGKLTFTETAELVRRADVFVGTDSGPLYIAESVGTKTLSLFGPTNPLFSAPRGKGHTYIYNKLFCSADDNVQNCKLIAGLNCRTVDCMKIIKPVDVYNSISAIIK